METKEWVALFGDIGSILTAVMALVVSIKALKAQNKHNELSLMPVCEVYTANFEDYLAVELHNKGLGMLEILEVEFVDVSGAKYYNLHEMILDKKGMSYNTLWSKKVLMSGEKVTVISFAQCTEEQRKKIISTISDVKIHIKYRDIYKNEYSFDNAIIFV